MAEMTREQFDKIGRAVGQAAQILPQLDFLGAKQLNDKIVEEIKKTRDGQRGEERTYSDKALERVELYGEMLVAAFEFKRAANKLVDLGLASGDFPLEETITADDRPPVMRSVDTPQASRRTDRPPREPDSTS